MLWHQIVVSLCLFYVSYLENHYVEFSWVQLPTICKGNNPTVDALVNWLLNFFLPTFPWCSMCLRCMDYIMDISTGSGHLRVICFLNPDWLWNSLLVSDCWRKMYFDEEWKLYFSVKIRISRIQLGILMVGKIGRSELFSRFYELISPRWLSRFIMLGIYSLLLGGP